MLALFARRGHLQKCTCAFLRCRIHIQDHILTTITPQSCFCPKFQALPSHTPKNRWSGPMVAHHDLLDWSDRLFARSVCHGTFSAWEGPVIPIGMPGIPCMPGMLAIPMPCICMPMPMPGMPAGTHAVARSLDAFEVLETLKTNVTLRTP